MKYIYKLLSQHNTCLFRFYIFERNLQVVEIMFMLYTVINTGYYIMK